MAQSRQQIRPGVATPGGVLPPDWRAEIDPRKLMDGAPVGPRWNALWYDILVRVAQSATGSNYGAGVADLDLTRPFHDKRIVELALAIPDSLRFRDGRERWLARTAFADVMPSSLIDRLPGNDREQPDLIRMNVQSAATMLATVRNLTDRDAVTRYIDLDALETMISGEISEKRMSDRIRLNFAMQTLTTARFLAWLDRSNQ